jgi:hypothetical protein
MIHHTDIREDRHPRTSSSKYITKVDQYLRLKGGRSFGHGVVPKRGTDKKMGRPRTKNIFDELPWVPGRTHSLIQPWAAEHEASENALIHACPIGLMLVPGRA